MAKMVRCSNSLFIEAHVQVLFTRASGLASNRTKETFVEIHRFDGTCYKAGSGWELPRVGEKRQAMRVQDTPERDSSVSSGC